VLIGKMERLHEKMMRGFWIGNQMVWCFRGCNPAPEALLILVVKELLEELEQPSFLQAKGIVRCSSEGQSRFNMVDGLDDILLKCSTLEEKRLAACSFLGKYGVWFWRFDASHWYVEVLLMIHKLSFALAIGLLQKYEKCQVVVGCLLNVALFAFLIVAQPFNERGRWMVEVLAQGSFTFAVTLVMLHVLEVELDMDVGFAVNTSIMGGMVIKMLYQFSKTIKAVIKKLSAVCAAPLSRPADLTQAAPVQATAETSITRSKSDLADTTVGPSQIAMLDSSLHSMPSEENVHSLERRTSDLDVELSTVFCVQQTKASACDHQI